MKENLIKYLREFEYPENYINVFLPSMDKLLGSKDAKATLEYYIEEYKSGNLLWDEIGEDAVKYAPMEII